MENKSKFKPAPKLCLMDQLRQVIRYHHYSYRTEQTYHKWEIESFLSQLAVKENCLVSTQRQALNAIVSLYRQVLDMDFSEELVTAKALCQGR